MARPHPLVLAGAALIGWGAPASAQESAPESVTRTVDLVGSIDFQGLAADPARAQAILRLADSLASQTAEGSSQRAQMDGLRAMVFAATGRGAESVAIVDRVIAAGHAEPAAYGTVWGACEMLEDGRCMARIIAAAAGAVPAAQRPALYDLFEPESVGPAAERAEQRHDGTMLRPLYEALVSIGWPGDSRAELRDDSRLRLADMRLGDGDRRGARELARLIRHPAPILKLAVLRRYRGLLAEGRDAPRLVGDAIAREDSVTAAALAGQQTDSQVLLNRVGFLISIGRFEEALAMIEPRLRDVRATVAAEPRGNWLVEQAAYALLGLGRAEEGAALFARLVAIPLTDQPHLLDQQINYAGFLWLAGRSREALDHIERLEREHDERINDFGRVWLWSNRVCALAELGRADEARPWLERMRPILGSYDGLLMRSYLCLNDMAAAEAMMLERLRAPWPAPAVVALQDWRVAEAGEGPAPALEARLAALRTRPAVAAALRRVGRVLSLPLARSYWGSF